MGTKPDFTSSAGLLQRLWALNFLWIASEFTTTPTGS